jgi:RNA polymerase-binding transcription factor DksA
MQKLSAATGQVPEPARVLASDDSLEQAVETARPPDQSSVEHAPDGTRTEVELAAAAERLREERDEVRARLASMTTDLESLFAAAVDWNADDEHDPEGQTIAYERSQFEALIQGARDHLAGIEAGLLRLGQGSYGICEVCHQPIPAARLDARPTARTCVQHAARIRG